jgi:hypothetical protein
MVHGVETIVGLVSKPTMDPRYFGTVNRARQIPPMPGIGAGPIAQGR